MSDRDEEKLRQAVLEAVSAYYDGVHRPKQELPFVPGQSTVNYAGRVYDHDEIASAVEACLDFRLTTDRFAKQFEKGLADRLGATYAMLVNSGSSANLVAFYSLTSPLLGDKRLQRGDEVITVAAGFPTTVAPIIQFGAVPVFVDVEVDNGTYDIDVSLLEAALSDRTKAVMLAHTLGNPFDIQAVRAFCKRHELWLIEDNCDALGSLYDGKPTGTFGDLATISFYPAHHITTGEGGAVVTNSGRFKRIAESFRDWGRDCWCEPAKDNTCGKRFDWKLGRLPRGYDHKYTYRHFGFNLKMTDMQAAIGVAQLKKLDSFIAARRQNWNLLREALADLEDIFVLPNATANSEPSWFGFVLTVRDNAGFTRDELTSALEAAGIQTRTLFAGNLLRHPAFNDLYRAKSGFRVIGDLPNTDRILTNTFWIGVYPGLKDGMVEYMADQIRQFVNSRAENRIGHRAVSNL